MCKDKDYVIRNKLFYYDLNDYIVCMNCSNMVKFGETYVVMCDGGCAIYHRYICEKCKFEREN